MHKMVMVVLPMDPDFFAKFFPKDQNGEPKGSAESSNSDEGGDSEQVGTGSGVIMDTDGKTAYILTNNHVAGGAGGDGDAVGWAGDHEGEACRRGLKVIWRWCRSKVEHVIPAVWGTAMTCKKVTGFWRLAVRSDGLVL